MLGGARSGKSALGEHCVGDGAVTYLATGRRRLDDPEWTDRIDAHRRTRSPLWHTVEAPTAEAVVDQLVAADARRPMLVDDLGTWLTGALDDADAWESPRGTVAGIVERLIDAVASYEGRVVLVSPEVGLGVIPASRAGRLFRDEIGALNARLAAVCDEVYLAVAGLATKLK